MRPDTVTAYTPFPLSDVNIALGVKLSTTVQATRGQGYTYTVQQDAVEQRIQFARDDFLY